MKHWLCNDEPLIVRTMMRVGGYYHLSSRFAVCVHGVWELTGDCKTIKVSVYKRRQRDRKGLIKLSRPKDSPKWATLLLNTWKCDSHRKSVQLNSERGCIMYVGLQLLDKVAPKAHHVWVRIEKET